MFFYTVYSLRNFIGAADSAVVLLELNVQWGLNGTH